MEEIRFATIEDAEKIAELELLCFPVEEAATYSSIKERIKTFPNHFWLLFDCNENGSEKELVSFINGMTTNERNLRDEMYADSGLHNENGYWQMIFGVDTRPDYQHKGFATKLMNRVISDTKQNGKAGIVLTCKEKLRGFYEKFGFVSEGVSDSTHGGVVWLQMRLTFEIH